MLRLMDGTISWRRLLVRSGWRVWRVMVRLYCGTRLTNGTPSGRRWRRLRARVVVRESSIRRGKWRRQSRGIAIRILLVTGKCRSITLALLGTPWSRSPCRPRRSIFPSIFRVAQWRGRAVRSWTTLFVSRTRRTVIGGRSGSDRIWWRIVRASGPVMVAHGGSLHRRIAIRLVLVRTRFTWRISLGRLLSRRRPVTSCKAHA